MFELQVKDFGPVVEGSVRLRPLTVLVGPNNSGKSYLAMLIYSLFRSARKMRPTFRTLQLHLPLIYFPNYRQGLTDWLDAQIIAQKGAQSLPVHELPAFLQETIEIAVRQWAGQYMAEWETELQRCWGATISALVRRARGVETFRLCVRHPEPPWELALVSEDGKLVQRGYTCDVSQLEVPLPDQIEWMAGRFAYGVERTPEFVLEQTVHPVLEAIDRHIARRMYYLPAARSGILQSHKALASSIVAASPLLGTRSFDIPRLSGVVADFISALILLERERKGKLYDLGARLEKDLIKGEIIVEAGKLQYPEIYYRSRGSKYPLHRASSGVSELAPLLLLLKHEVAEGDVLIIEEPESHLHPALQRKMAGAIARLIRKGVRVLITTHSDYLLGQLSNLIRLGAMPEEERKAQGYDESSYIQAGEAAAYLFDYRGDKAGSKIRELEVSAEDGIPEDSFAQVAEALYDETVMLHRRLQR